jgi:hypothetical protein
MREANSLMEDAHETHEVHYLDMVGDGLPDAVEHIIRRRYGPAGGSREFIEETRVLSYGIGIDGVPAGQRERTRVFTRADAPIAAPSMAAAH